MSEFSKDISAAVCIAIPTYNNEKTLARTIRDSLQFDYPIVVVNDGATDGTAEILESFGNQISVITHPTNKGKGQALRSAFKWARAEKYGRLISIDSDGQHFPDDIKALVDASDKNPSALIIGSRNLDEDHIPGKSSFGNKFSNFWFWFETGIKLSDTQSGFRLYPLHAMKERSYWTTKFEFEIEVIVKAAWEGIPVVNEPIKVHYDEGKERISHFRPLRDFTRISVLNTVLVTLALLYYIPIRFLKKLTRENIHKFVREQLFNREESVFRKAASIGFGLFMGIFPIWGYQLIVGIPTAHFLKLNKAIFIVAAHISIPPMIPFILYGSYLVGANFVDNPQYLDLSKDISLATIHNGFVQYLVGAIVLAAMAGVIGFAMSYLGLGTYRKLRGSSNSEN